MDSDGRREIESEGSGTANEIERVRGETRRIPNEEKRGRKERKGKQGEGKERKKRKGRYREGNCRKGKERKGMRRPQNNTKTCTQSEKSRLN